VHNVVVLGGYGRLGSACVSELLETTPCRIVVAGPSVQRAERAALLHGERVRGAYANAADPRTVGDVLSGADLVISCCSVPPLAALERALEARVPLLSLTRMTLSHSTTDALSESAWDAGIPVILHAGATPGLPGLTADFLLRRLERARLLRIASTGNGDPARLRLPTRLGDLRPPQRFHFPGGVRLMQRVASPDLDGFAEGHCVDRLQYLEPDSGAFGAAAARLLGWRAPRTFTLVAEAWRERVTGRPDARLVLRAESSQRAAAVTAGALARAVLDGTLPAGVLTPHEALNPAAFLDTLAKRGVRVLHGGPDPDV